MKKAFYNLIGFKGVLLMLLYFNVVFMLIYCYNLCIGSWVSIAVLSEYLIIVVIAGIVICVCKSVFTTQMWVKINYFRSGRHKKAPLL